MLFEEIPEKDRRGKILKTIERIKEIGDCDLFHEFKKDFPEITVRLLEFSNLFENMERKGEIKW